MNLLHKFRMFFGKEKLVSAIKRTTKLLDQSEDSDWSSLSAEEIKQILEQELNNIAQNKGFNKVELAVLYAPTGAIQETAMVNGWDEEYLKIAEIIDKFTGR